MALNILVVDDSAVTRAMVIKVLKMTDLPLGELFQAADGKEGLAKLGENWVDLVITDINMPVMNGEEMIEEVRKNSAWADLPVLVVSTEGSQTRIERLHQHGARFIHKPFTPEAVRDVIRELIGVTHEQS